MDRLSANQQRVKFHYDSLQLLRYLGPNQSFGGDRPADLCLHPERRNWKSGYISIKGSGSCEPRRL